MTKESAAIMREIRTRNAEIGHHFFSPGAMRFFQSKIHELYVGPSGKVFYTSEQYETSPRTYRVRYVRKDGSIGTIGPPLFDILDARSCAQYLSGRYSMDMIYLSDSPTAEVMNLGPALLKKELPN